MIAPIPALYYTETVYNGSLTTNLVIAWLSNKLLCLLLIPMAYNCTETRLILAGRVTQQHALHIDGSSTSCTSPIRSYN